MIRELMLRRVEAVMASRPPDFEIGPEGDRYLLRWYLTPWSRYERGSKPKNRLDAFSRRLPNLYAHRFLRDDEDRALHDHPWPSISWLLRGNYWEVLFYPLSDAVLDRLRESGEPRPTTRRFRREGSINARSAEAAHRVVLERRAGKLGRTEPVPVVTLFLTGFVVREWGFHCAKGWRHWREFVDSRDKGSVGRGCE